MASFVPPPLDSLEPEPTPTPEAAPQFRDLPVTPQVVPAVADIAPPVTPAPAGSQQWIKVNGAYQNVPNPEDVNWTAAPSLVNTTTSGATNAFTPPPLESLEPEEAAAFTPPPPDSLERNFTEVSSDYLNQFMRGATSDGGIFSGIEGAARGLANQSKAKMEGRDTITKSEDGTYKPDYWNGARQGVYDFLTSYADDTADLRTDIREALPVSEEFQKSLPGQIVAGFGQVPANLAAYTIPGVGPLMSVGQLYDETYQDAKAHGASEEKAHEAGLYSLPAGALDIAMDKLVIGKILKPFKGKISVGELAKTFATTGIAGGTTEGMQQAWQNFTAKYLAGYDQERKLDDQVLNSIIVGALVDAGVSTAGQAAMNAAAPKVEQPNTTGAGPITAPAAPGNLSQLRVEPEAVSPEDEAEFFGPPPEAAPAPAMAAAPGSELRMSNPIQLTAASPDAWTMARGIGDKMQAMMPNGPKIEVVRNADELKGRYEDETHASISNSKTEAFYDPNSDVAVLISDHFAPQAGETLEHYITRKSLHEAAGHGGLQRIFDGPLADVYGETMVSMYKRLSREDFGEAWGKKHGYRTLQQLANAPGYEFNLKTPHGIFRAVEEHLSRMAEEPVVPKWFDGVVAAITRWIRSMGHSVWTDSDTRTLLAQARRAVGLPAGRRGELSFSKVIDEAAANPGKKRGFVESVQNAQQIAPDIRERVAGVYTPVSNPETVAAANDWINVQGIDGSLAQLLANQHPDATAYAAGIEMITRLQGAGRFEDGAALVEHMAETATDQGRAIQVLSLLSKLTPEGVQVYAARVIKKAVKKSPALADIYGQVSKLREELRVAKKRLATVALLNAKRRGTNEKVLNRINRLMVENKGSLWGRYKQQAVSQLAAKMVPGEKNAPPWLQEFTSNLTRHLREQLRPLTPATSGAPAAPKMSEAEAIGHAIRNFDKYQEVWTQAQTYMRERYKKDPATLKALDDYFGQILEKPFSAESVERALKQAVQTLNLNMREILMQGGADKAQTRAQLEQLILDGAKVSKAEAMGLADSVQHAFETQQRLEREKLLKQMMGLTGTHKIPKSKLEKLIGLNNAGALDDSRFFAALAKQYGIPAWTPELSAKVQRLQSDYEKAKDPNVKLAKAAQMFDAIHELLPSDVFAKARALQNIAMLLNPKTIIRNVVGNVAMFAADVSADAVTMGVVDPLVSIVTGKRTRRSLDVATRLRGLAEPVRDYWNGYQFARDEGASKAASINEGVQTLLTLARLSSRGKYDIGQINAGNSRVLTSAAGKMLEDSLSVALAVGDRAFHQSAYQASIMRQMKLAEADGVKLIGPTPEMVTEAMGDAGRAVFQDDNFVSAALRKIGQGLNLFTTAGKSDKYGLGAVILPFSQVPGSIAMRGIEWSPLGFIRASYETLRPLIKREGFQQKEFADAFSRATLGTAVYGLGWYLFKVGIVTALDDEDPDLNAMRQSSGLGKFLLNISALQRAILTGNWWAQQKPQDGDVTVNYDWLQPNAMALAMGAEVGHQQAIRARTPASQQSTLPAWVQDAAAGGKAAVLTLENQPLLTGLGRYFRDAGQNGVITGTAQQALDAPGMFIPTFISQANQLMDGMVRETRAGSPLDQALARIEARIPGLAENYPPKYDVFGEAQERYSYGGNSFFNVMINPAFLNTVKATPELAEINRVYQATGDVRVIPSKAPVKLQLAGQSIELTNDQISQYQKTLGTLTMAFYTRLSASPQFAAAPVGAKAAVMAKGLSAIGSITKLQVLRGNPDLVDELREQVRASQSDQAALLRVP